MTNRRAAAQRLASGERFVPAVQSGADLAAGHIARYEHARAQIRPGEAVLDLACGVGYGARMIAASGATVTGIDRDPDAIRYARAAPGSSVAFECGDFFDVYGTFDVVVSFETIEHLPAPLPLALFGLARLTTRLLIGSVPIREQPGNHFHCHFDIDERDLAPLHAWGRLEYLYQAADGGISPTADAATQNLIFLLHRDGPGVFAAPVARPTLRPRVSVVVPVRSHAAAACAALDSIYRLRDERIEAVIVDCAGDGVPDRLIERYASVLPCATTLRVPGHVGDAVALRHGVYRCAAPYVTCLLPGTTVRQDWLAHACTVLDGDAGIDAVVGGVSSYDDTVGFVRDWRPLPERTSGVVAALHNEAGQLAMVMRAASFDFRLPETSAESWLAACLTQAGSVASEQVSAIAEWRTARPSAAWEPSPGPAYVVPSSIELPRRSDLAWQRRALMRVVDELLSAGSVESGKLRGWWHALLSLLASSGEPDSSHRDLLDRWLRLPGMMFGTQIAPPGSRPELAPGSPTTHSGLLAALPLPDLLGFWKTSSLRCVHPPSDVAAGRPVLIWGSGEGGRLVVECSVAPHIEAFVDSAPNRQGRQSNGLHVISPDELFARLPRPFVVVASVAGEAIANDLSRHGWMAGEDYAIADLTFAQRANRS